MILRNTERKRAIALTSVESSQGGDYEKPNKKAKRSASPDLSIITEMQSKMEDQAKEIAKLRRHQKNSSMNAVSTPVTPVTPAGPSNVRNNDEAVNESVSGTTRKKWLIF